MRHLAAVAVLVLGVGACGGGSPATQDDAVRDASGRIIESGDVGTQVLQVGDCFMEPDDGGAVQAVTGVPCSRPHDAQMIARVVIPDADDWPGTDGVTQVASERCIDAAAAVPAENLGGGVGLSGYAPDERSWDAGDRDIVCFVEGTGNDLLDGDVFS